MRGLYSNIIASSYRPAVAPGIVTTNLVNYLDFSNISCYPGTGTTVNDLVDSITYTVYGPTFSGGVVGGVFSFDGINDYIRSSATVSKSGDLSVGVWYWRNTTTLGNMGLWDLEDSSTDGYRHLIDENAGSYYQRSRMNGNSLDTTTATSNQTWYYFVMTWNDSTGANVIYENGSSAISTTFVTSFNVVDEYIMLGGVSNGGSVLAAAPFRGYISEAHIYNRVLTPTEVTQNWDATKARYGY